MTRLLSVRNLDVRYRRDGKSVQALSGISFDVGQGERLAIIGESGSGKSTLALALGELLPPGAAMTGDISWPAFPSPPRNGKDIGFVFQDPAGSLDPVRRVGDQIAEIARTHLALDRQAAGRAALDLIGRVRLPDPPLIAGAFPHQLSGGQQQRIAIACAIAARPRLLIADEATSALDTVVQAQIVELVLSLVREEDLSLIFITHDIALAANVGDRIAVFRSGEIIEIRKSSDIVSSPQHDYTRGLVAARVTLESAPMLGAAGSPAGDSP